MGNVNGFQLDKNIVDCQGLNGPAGGVLLSGPGTGRIYFDATSNTFKASLNGAAFVDITTGSASVITGTTNSGTPFLTVIGSTGANSATGINNTAMGYQAGNVLGTSTDNAVFGFQAGALTTGSNNAMLGSSAGDGVTSGARNVLVGKDAGGASGSGAMSDVVAVGYQAGLLNTQSQNTFIGSSAGAANIGGTGQTFVGYQAGTVATGGGNTLIGFQTGASITTGNFNTLIGGSITGSTALVGAIAIGWQAIAANNTFVAGGTGGAINDVFFGRGITDATPTAYTLNGSGGSGSDISGANLQLAGGKGTGVASPGLVVLKYPLLTTTGSALQSLSTQSYPVSATMFTGSSVNISVDASTVGTTETTLLGTLVGSQSLEGGLLRVGRSIRITAVGFMSTSVSPATFRIRLKKGTTAILDTQAFTPVASITTLGFSMMGIVNIKSVGVSGSSIGNGLFQYITPTSISAVSSMGAAPTLDTTTTQNLDLTIQFGASTAGNNITVQNVLLEILN